MLHPTHKNKNVSVLNGPVWSLAILTFLALSGNLSFTSIREWTRKTPRKWHLRAQDGAAVDAAPVWQKLLEGKDYVNLVQIGACDGDFGSTSSNDPVQHFMMNEPKIRALLVEASPSTYETLRRKVADLHEDRLRTVNAAVAPFLQEKVPEVVVRKVDRFQHHHHHHHHHHPLLGSSVVRIIGRFTYMGPQALDFHTSFYLTLFQNLGFWDHQPGAILCGFETLSRRLSTKSISLGNVAAEFHGQGPRLETPCSFGPHRRGSWVVWSIGRKLGDFGRNRPTGVSTGITIERELGTGNCSIVPYSSS